MSSSYWYKDIPLSLKIHGDMNAKTVCPLWGSVVHLGLIIFHSEQLSFNAFNA